MEKKLYELKINPVFDSVLPPLKEEELRKLTNHLIEEGCRDALVTWNDVILDGHNRYRICWEHNIPFEYKEMEFESETAAKLWIIDTQLGRRNVPGFVKVENVLPLEDEIKAEARKRQGTRNDLKNIPQNSAECEKQKETREILAEMAGVSRDTLAKAKMLINSADEETKEKLRSGELSIHRAYTALKNPQENEDGGQGVETPEVNNTHTETSSNTSDEPVKHTSPLVERSDAPAPRRSDLLPGYGLVKDLPPMAEGAYVRPPDSVYDIPPIEVYGNMPADDMELRGKAEIVHAKSDLTYSTENYVRRVSEILRGMTAASVNDENIDALREIVTNGYENIINLLNSKLIGGK